MDGNHDIYMGTVAFWALLGVLVVLVLYRFLACGRKRSCRTDKRASESTSKPTQLRGDQSSSGNEDER